MGTLKSFAGYMLGRIISTKVIPGLVGLQPGRYPHPKYGPIEIPEERRGLLPFRLTDAGYFMAYGGLIYYLAKRKPRPEPGTTGLEAPQDPVEACMAGAGWNLTEFRGLRDAIGEKTESGEELTAEENYALDAIESCIDRIERQHGSLEAAGLAQVPCPICGDDQEIEGDQE